MKINIPTSNVQKTSEINSFNIKTPIYPERLDSLLKGYDKHYREKLISGFTYGFRLHYKGPRNISRLSLNSSSTAKNPEIVDKLIEKELLKNHIMGPFTHKPFEHFICSPIVIIPKKDDTFRFIHNLSAPENLSINDNIPRSEATVQYETLDYVVNLVRRFGKGCLLAKADIENAFRLIPIHPADYHLLGFQWRNRFFINSSLAMGCSTSCKTFESFSCALQWIINKNMGMHNVSHIIDDFIFCGPKDNNVCMNTLQYFFKICKDINIPIKHSKTVFPTTLIQAHGCEIDTIQFEVRLPQDKINKCKNAILDILPKQYIYTKELHKLLGLLNFACKCVVPGRTFKRRLEDLTIGLATKVNTKILLDEEAKEDLHIWLKFLAQYNGKSLILDKKWILPSTLKIYTDASGIGYGGYCNTQWFAGLWPKNWYNVNIHVKEIFPIFILISMFEDYFKNKKLLLFCDNQAVVEIVNKMTSKDKHTMKFVRQIAFITMKNNFHFRIVHIKSSVNEIADKLSRNLLQDALKRAPFLQETPVIIPQSLMPQHWMP